MLWRCQAESPLETKSANMQEAPESVLELCFWSLLQEAPIHWTFQKVRLFSHLSQGSNALYFFPYQLVTYLIHLYFQMTLKRFGDIDRWSVFRRQSMNQCGRYQRLSWMCRSDQTCKWYFNYLPSYTVFQLWEGWPAILSRLLCVFRWQCHAHTKKRQHRALTFDRVAAAAAL